MLTDQNIWFMSSVPFTRIPHPGERLAEFNPHESLYRVRLHPVGIVGRVRTERAAVPTGFYLLGYETGILINRITGISGFSRDAYAYLSMRNKEYAVYESHSSLEVLRKRLVAEINEFLPHLAGG